mmetsp:Transcript_42687/g.48510  ORF Transcript_42687/g.48510 Transcript_42687/m.48510 type:complete len:208 (+) Transcript_42687:183-806(+)
MERFSVIDEFSTCEVAEESFFSSVLAVLVRSSEAFRKALEAALEAEETKELAKSPAALFIFSICSFDTMLSTTLVFVSGLVSSALLGSVFSVENENFLVFFSGGGFSSTLVSTCFLAFSNSSNSSFRFFSSLSFFSSSCLFNSRSSSFPLSFSSSISTSLLAYTSAVSISSTFVLARSISTHSFVADSLVETSAASTSVSFVFVSTS